MRKKWMTAGIGFGVGVVMLIVGGFSAMANTSGYDAYKAALKNTKAETSLTAHAELSVTDNGTKLIAGTADAKLNQDLNAGSVTAALSNGTETLHSVNVYRQDGKVIIKSGDTDVYRVMDNDSPNWQQEGAMPHPPQAMEQVFDALLGNIRELATVNNESDGGRHAELHLSGSQIPAVVQVLGTLAVSKAAEAHGAEMKVNLPQLTDRVKIEQIDLDAKIDPDHRLEGQTAEIHITGQDDSGKQHALVIRLQIDFSGFDQTTPDRIDLTGKPTEEIQHQAPKHSWHH